MHRSALILIILAVTAGCDKPKEPSEQDRPPSFDVGTRPTLVFEAFGTRDSTRLVPIAAIINGEATPIDLPSNDWRRLDSLYFQAGTEYPVYRDGQPAGTVKVERRMWEPDSQPVYELPGCREVRPMAAVKLSTTVPLDPAFEFLSMSVPRVSTPPTTPAPPAPRTPRTPPPQPEPRDLIAQVRALAVTALGADRLGAEDIDSASFSARAIHVAAGAKPTLVASQVDANAGDAGPGAGVTTHFLVLGDDPDGTGYQISYRHLESAEARTVEFQRVLDHLDITGDGTDEIFVESWHYGSTNDLLVLTRSNGKWREMLRVRQEWCVRKR